MKRRLNILRAVGARDWGADTLTLRHLYIAFIRPAGLYAAGQWWPFTAASTRQKLETVNYQAARVISGVGAGTRAAVACTDANLPPIDLVALRDAGSIFLKLRRFPPAHHLHRLTIPPPHPVRLKARGTGHLRPSWRTAAMSFLQEAGLGGIDPEPPVQPVEVPAPWTSSADISFHEVPGTSRDMSPPVRRALSLEFLHTLRLRLPPNIEVWTDGAAVGGTSDGGGGYVIQWQAPGPDTIGSVPAGRITSSTAAEATAAAAALRVVEEELLMTNRKYIIWLVFDSRALLDRLRRPNIATLDRPSAEALRRLHSMARAHHVAVVWVPGHAGLHLNEVADEAARRGTSLEQPDSTPSFQSAVNRLNKFTFGLGARRRYLDQVPADHVHRRISGGAPMELNRSRRRVDHITLCQLRADRAPFLAATMHRWGRVDSPSCPHCGGPREDTDHFIKDCPKWETERRAHLGNHPVDITVLQTSAHDVLHFVAAAGFIEAPTMSS